MSVLVRYPVPRPDLRVIRPPVPGPLYYFEPRPTINILVGFETGDLTEATNSFSGPPVVQNTITRTGGYAVECGAGDRFRILLFNAKPKVSDRHVFGFAFYTTSIAPSAEGFMMFLSGAGDASFNLVLETDGDLRVEREGSGVVGTITSPFTAATWHYIEIYIENINSGSIEVVIDGTSELTASSQDFEGLSGKWDEIQLRNNSTGPTFYYDDFYWMSGATDINDRLGGNASEQAAGVIPEIWAYQKTDGGATDQGDALDTGTWALASETPAVTGAGNRAEYTTTDAAGSMRTNSGSRSGPSGDANIDGDSNIIAAKYTYILTTDIASDHIARYGNDSDGTQEQFITVGTGNTTIEIVSEDPAVVPLSTEVFDIGGRANGANDLRFEELWGHVLHIPTAAAAGRIMSSLADGGGLAGKGGMAGINGGLAA